MAGTSFEKLTGTTLDEYELLDYLGHTGLAHVYRARNADSTGPFEVHLLPSHFVARPEFVEHFLVEAGILATLDHPNILRTLDFGVLGSSPYLVTEYIEGPTLKDLIEATNRRQVRIPMDVTVFIVNSLGSALAYAHKNLIAHTDLKPRNVLLESSGRVMLVDFGLARLMSPPQETEENRLPGAMREPRYSDRAEETRGDVYSLGWIFYQLATGRLPYDAGTGPLGSLALEAQPISPQSVYPEIPDEVNAVILKAVAPNHQTRYQTVEELLAALANYRWKVKTTVLPSARLSDVAYFSSRYSSLATPPTYDNRHKLTVSLYFLDTGQILDLEPGKEYIIGRKYESQAVIPDIDLSPFKAYEWGISRLHAKLNTNPRGLTITDMHSSNGTWHAGKRIPPDMQYPLHSGDLVLLGKLRIQILLSQQS